MIADAQWQAFLQRVRVRLKSDSEVFVSSDTLTEACFITRPFWEELEERWRRKRPTDFDYRGQHFETVSGEPTAIHFWRKS